MQITRREFVKHCVASGMVIVPGISLANIDPFDPPSKPCSPARIEKSIKAGFGGGFSLQAHRQSGALTYANIEHSGNRYTVASADLFDWAIVSTS